MFNKKNIFMPYFTFGDPSIEFTKELIIKSLQSGADAIELGIPFSDPIADGPIIQASHHRALTNNPNINIDQAFKFTKKIKKQFPQKFFVFMIGVNLIYHYGIDKFFKNAQDSNLYSVVIPDLPLEEAKDYLIASKKYHVGISFLVSPLCEPKRLKKIVQASQGFVYLISSLGTTGERSEISNKLSKIVHEIKKIKAIPVIIGFGISKKEHLEQIYSFAEGAIIGSYFIRQIQENLLNLQKAIEEIISQIKNFTKGK